MASPTPITPATVGAAVIGYESNLTACTAAPQVIIPNTFERWRPTTSGSIVATATATAPSDYVGIAAHNLGTAGVTLTVEVASSIGGAKTTVYNAIPSSDRALLITFTEQNVQEVTITVDGACELGVVYCGKLLEMERPCVYAGHTPANLNANTEYQNSVSESGQWLGRSIVRKGLEGSYQFNNLSQTFVRDEFMLFVESAKTTPFFMQWRPDDHSLDVIYAWTTGDIAPSNNGSQNFMDVSFNVRAHDDL